MSTFKWDVPLGTKIDHFDPELTYELTGYRPVDESTGFDFDPMWFTEASQNKQRTGRYSNNPVGSRAYRNFWVEEKRRCEEGHVVNGYRITGDHYFFLNYYILLNVSRVQKAGAGRLETQPDFWSKHYEYFHYIELCEHLGKDVIAFKARGVGFSEIAASLAVRPYTTTKNYSVVFAAFSEGLVEPTMAKCWSQLEYLNLETEGGFRRLRQVKDTALHKKASVKDSSGQEKGHMAEIKGLAVDNSRKLRGRRIDRLVYEEAGSNPILLETYIKGEALVELNGIKMGTRIVFGTGGDSGPALAGLDAMFKAPQKYGGLPYKHKYTQDGQYAYTGFFIPAHVCVSKFKDEETGSFIQCMDHRGVTDSILAKSYYDRKRRQYADDPQALLDYCAEYCYYPEEALIKQGQNNFNQVLLAQQYAELEIHKTVKPPERGNLFWNYDSQNNIIGVKWVQDNAGKVLISEHPLADEDGNAYKNLYVAGVDSIDHGVDDSVVGERGSQFAIVVKKRMMGTTGNRYVCSYMERPKDVREAYSLAAKILWYYGCKANLEDTKIGLRTWLREKKLDYKMLMTRPSFAMDDSKKRQGNLWGTPGSDKMILHGLNLVGGFIEDAWNTIDDIEMLKQLQKFSYEDKGKFDKVLAMVYAEIGDEDMYDLRVVKDHDYDKTFQDVGYYIDDYGIKRFGVIPNSNMYDRQRN